MPKLVCDFSFGEKLYLPMVLPIGPTVVKCWFVRQRSGGTVIVQTDMGPPLEVEGPTVFYKTRADAETAFPTKEIP